MGRRRPQWQYLATRRLERRGDQQPHGAGGGVSGGGQIGYNYALSPLAVIGAEADLQGASLLSGSGLSPGYLQNSNGAVSYVPGWLGGGVSIHWFGTARARVGVTPLPTLLLYGTGGFAYAKVENAYGGSLGNQVSAVQDRLDGGRRRGMDVHAELVGQG